MLSEGISMYLSSHLFVSFLILIHSSWVNYFSINGGIYPSYKFILFINLLNNSLHLSGILPFFVASHFLFLLLYLMLHYIQSGVLLLFISILISFSLIKLHSISFLLEQPANSSFFCVLNGLLLKSHFLHIL